MYDKPTNFAERRFDAYERYLANMRGEIAPMLGTNVLLATVTLGLTEAAAPKSEIYNNSFETYSRPLGEKALAPVVQLHNRPNIHAAIEAQAA